ncbi:hypothetical protein LCGC14_1130500 [marine sediment metagenome]|uniref:Uncharacterized protein n=1 Tax=marine sediment metagenome TaxID=412755 RepID=A0A0F9PJG6_9ZZZZ
MKKLALTFVLVLAMASVVWGSPYLAVDVPTGDVPTISEVEINGIVQSGIIQLSADSLSYLLLDLDSFATGSYTFKVRWHDGFGWWSDWSDPFEAGKPGRSGILKIISE